MTPAQAGIFPLGGCSTDMAACFNCQAEPDTAGSDGLLEAVLAVRPA